MKILITGGAGFVGSSMALSLKTKYPEYSIYVLDNLKFVDFVYIFDGVRCVDFLDQSKPHVYTKGGDYSIDSLHKGELKALMAHQTQINIIKLKYNISTTSILSNI